MMYCDYCYVNGYVNDQCFKLYGYLKQFKGKKKIKKCFKVVVNVLNISNVVIILCDIFFNERNNNGMSLGLIE